jgi:hypothetical protein
MDPRALGEALLAVSVTPVVSIAMALFVFGGVFFLLKRLDRK